MRHLVSLGKFLVVTVAILVGTLGWSESVGAGDAGLSNSPYASVAARNIFGLKSPAAVPPAAAEAPFKITLSGVLSAPGRAQALFKVLPRGFSNGQAREKFYLLAEGQKQDGIEVLQVNVKSGLAVFNNHGTIQTLSLAKAVSDARLPSGEPLTPAQILFQTQYQ
jgi:hypothetical protein